MNDEQHGAFGHYTSTVLMHFRLMRRPRADSTDPQPAGQMLGDLYVSVRVVRPTPRSTVLQKLTYELLQQALIALGRTPQEHQKLRHDIRLLLLALNARQRAKSAQGGSHHG